MYYFDIPTNEFYTGTEKPYNYTATGTVIESRLESFITNISSQYTTIRPIPQFDETQAKIQINASPVEAKLEDGVYKIKYGYVSIIPRSILNGTRLFRVWAYSLGEQTKAQTYFSGANFRIHKITVICPNITDITLKKEFNTFSAIAEFTIVPTA